MDIKGLRGPAHLRPRPQACQRRGAPGHVRGLAQEVPFHELSCPPFIQVRFLRKKSFWGIESLVGLRAFDGDILGIYDSPTPDGPEALASPADNNGRHAPASSMAANAAQDAIRLLEVEPSTAKFCCNLPCKAVLSAP